MGGICRTWVKRLLRRQRRAHNRSWRKQNRGAMGTLKRYLRSRQGFDFVDKLLSQAEGTRDILVSLIEKGVPIPAAVKAEVEGKVAKYTEEKAALVPEEIFPEDLYFKLPKELGVPDVEKIDFRVGVPAREEGSSEEEVEGIEGEESSEEGDEEEKRNEDGEEEDEEEGSSSGEGSKGEKRSPEGETAAQQAEDPSSF